MNQTQDDPHDLAAELRKRGWREVPVTSLNGSRTIWQQGATTFDTVEEAAVAAGLSTEEKNE